MAEHWCKEHQTVWFKKGTMKGYAHPIKDENGEDTKKWCNEPREETEEKPTAKRDSSTNASIEAQVAVKAIIELRVADRITEDSQLALTADNWIMSKLGYWSSVGIPPEEPEAKEPTSTKEQRAKILSTYKERGYSDSLALSIMIRLYGVSSSKALTKAQASEFIKILESGKYLEELKPSLTELGPEDLPF